MSLRLSVVSFNGGPVPDPLTVEFASGGGSIGRGAKATMRLNDPERIVSTKHAEIACRDGAYYLSDTSTNGVYVNASQKPLGRGNEVRINANDKFRLGGYELVAELDAGVAVQPRPAAQNPSDPLAAVSGSPGQGGVAGLGPADVIEPFRSDSAGPIPPPAPGGSPGLAIPGDPLAAGPSLIPDDLGSDLPAEQAQQSDRAPLLSSHFRLPDAIPDAALPPPADAAPAPRQPAGAIPSNWDTEPGAPVPETPGAVTGRIGDPLAPAGDPIGPIGKIGDPLAPPPAAPIAPPPAAPVAPPAPPPAASPPAAAGHGSDDAFIRTVLQTAGLGDLAVDAAARDVLARNIGEILRETVSGIVAILTERTNFKTEFRVDTTQLKPAENNPLKFSSGVEETLRQLLTNERSGMISGGEAVRESFDDLRTHQMGVMAGLSASLKALMTRIDPAEIEGHTAAGGILESMLPAARAAKNWETFVEVYRDIDEDAAEGFRRLLADEFARAYQEQESRMKRARRKDTGS